MALTQVKNNGLASSGLPAGAIIQVITATDNTVRTLAGDRDQALADMQTVVSAAITPSSTSSKVLILGKVTVGGPGDGKEFQLFLKRGSSGIGGNTNSDMTGGSNYMCSGTCQSNEGGNTYSFSHLDSPSTTSATTYTIVFNGSEESTTYYLHRGNTSPGAYHYYNSADSSITLLEVAG